jgi:hypothetical protein
VENLSDASILFAFDLASGDWSPALVNAFELPGKLYPKVAPCSQVIGELTPAAAAELGLNPGVPVVAGGEDTSSAGLAIGVTEPGQALLSLGTAGTIYIVEDKPMATIETTLGPLSIEKLGRINAHDHVIIDGGLTVVNTPDFRLDSVAKAIEEVGSWKESGGGAIVDTMPFGCGRNMDKLVAVSQATGVPIIVPTGFQKSGYYLPDHWQHKYNKENIAQLLIAELTEGADRNGYEGPLVERSRVKASFVKVAGDYQVVKPITRKLIQAAGQVHQATGAPILVHTEMGTVADQLLDLLEAAGILPNRVCLAILTAIPISDCTGNWPNAVRFCSTIRRTASSISLKLSSST